MIATGALYKGTILVGPPVPGKSGAISNEWCIHVVKLGQLTRGLLYRHLPLGDGAMYRVANIVLHRSNRLATNDPLLTNVLATEKGMLRNGTVLNIALWLLQVKLLTKFCPTTLKVSRRARHLHVINVDNQ